MTARVDATHMQGDDRAVLISDWHHCRSSHSEAWTKHLSHRLRVTSPLSEGFFATLVED